MAAHSAASLSVSSTSGSIGASLSETVSSVLVDFVDVSLSFLCLLFSSVSDVAPGALMG